MATFVLVPGGWQGGWIYEAVAGILVAHGHEALPMTLSGLGDTPAPAANLDVHVTEVIEAVKAAGDDVVLVGQSYGGMVVSGAADAAPSRLRALVYVDAYVPQPGDSVWSLTTQAFRELFVAGVREDGLNCAPPPGSDPRCRSHPMGAFLQSIKLSGRWREVPSKTFVGAFGWSGSPFHDLFHRLSAAPDWTTVAVECGHNVAKLQPEALARILLAQAQVTSVSR
jgi:pimeloyl-ACP methyl ester carboxylesterase